MIWTKAYLAFSLRTIELSHLSRKVLELHEFETKSIASHLNSIKQKNYE